MAGRSVIADIALTRAPGIRTEPIARWQAKAQPSILLPGQRPTSGARAAIYRLQKVESTEDGFSFGTGREHDQAWRFTGIGRLAIVFVATGRFQDSRQVAPA
jgi:hypothetical protein